MEKVKEGRHFIFLSRQILIFANFFLIIFLLIFKKFLFFSLVGFGLFGLIFPVFSIIKIKF
jgi:hypothetical protein